ERVVVTGIPNFDDCRRYHQNSFPHRGYVLVCTSDARETFKRDDRRAFLERCRGLAAGRPLIFKLHPNENAVRAQREVAAVCPDALVLAGGSGGEMIATCDALIPQSPSPAFGGVALGKEVHSYYTVEALRRLLPVQNGRAARNIAAVCGEVLAQPVAKPAE